MNPLKEHVFTRLGDIGHVERVVVRLAIAALLGGLVGLEREEEHKTAGLRTHMLVSLGAALFVVAALEAGVDAAELARVIQGVAVGIGFVGAGAIIKLERDNQVRGLTTAAGIWVAAAIGLAVGAGLLWPAVTGLVLVLTILYLLRRAAKR
jgi:putative Mg2+ transporter-C (MgtC) family protein